MVVRRTTNLITFGCPSEILVVTDDRTTVKIEPCYACTLTPSWPVQYLRHIKGLLTSCHCKKLNFDNSPRDLAKKLCSSKAWNILIEILSYYSPKRCNTNASMHFSKKYTDMLQSIMMEFSRKIIKILQKFWSKKEKWLDQVVSRLLQNRGGSCVQGKLSSLRYRVVLQLIAMLLFPVCISLAFSILTCKHETFIWHHFSLFQSQILSQNFENYVNYTCHKTHY